MVILDRLTACHWFKWREYILWGASAAVMAFLFFVLVLLFPALVAFGIALAATFCGFFYLSSQVIGIKCPHCKRPIETNTPWVCGYKDCRNENAFDFPFISECEHCHAEPKAYRCHHTDCRKLIFLTKDEHTINFAQCLNMPPPAKSEPKRVKKDKHEEEIVGIQKSIELKQKQVEEAKLAVDLKALRQTLEGPKMKNLEEIYRSKIRNEDDARRLHAAIDVEFPNDDDERKKRHMMVNNIMTDLL